MTGAGGVMSDSGNNWIKWIKKEHDVSLLKRCMLMTLIWGLVAHAYGFLNFTISHDSLEALYSGAAETEWKISIGRIFVTIYRLFTRGLLTAPWLIGLLSLVWIGLSVYLVARIFEKKTNVFIILISGIMTVNLTVTALTATFLHDLDIDMFALLMMVLAVYLWKKYCRGFCVGIVLITFALGLYQSYLSVAIALIIIVSITDLLDGKSFKTVMLHGIKGIIMLAGSAILYLALMNLICNITGVLLNDSYNSMSQIFDSSVSSLFWNSIKSYYYWFVYFLSPASLYHSALIGAANILLGICMFGIVCIAIFGEGLGGLEKLLLLLLGGLLPLGMNISCVLSHGVLHGLMMYAFCFVYLLALLLAEWMKKNAQASKARFANAMQLLMIAIVVLVIWNGIPISNAAYLKKDLERQQTLSLMTRVTARMDSLEDYESGVTPVAFVGKIDMDEMPGFEVFEGDGNTTGVQGLTANDQIKNYRDYEAYFKYILNIPINLCEEETRLELWETETVQNMMVFPEEGCMKMVDGILVVKMGENY